MRTWPSILSTLLPALVLIGCQRETAFPPPPQATPKPYFARVMLDMTPGIPPPFGAAIRSGVEPPAPGLNWRWLSSPASFSFELEDRVDWQLDIHLVVVDKVQQQLGHQRLIVNLNGKTLITQTLDKSGPVVLTLPAQPGPKPTLELQIEPCLPEPHSPPYCVLIQKVGWLRELKGEYK